MKRNAYAFLCLVIFFTVQRVAGQEEAPAANPYQATKTISSRLVHTKLNLSFDLVRAQAQGAVVMTLQPYSGPVGNLDVDAKGMDLQSVTLHRDKGDLPLKYEYDGAVIHIRLDRPYKKGEIYKIYIKYTSKPNEWKVNGAAATVSKGLYFIKTPSGKDTAYQVWTQGETEATSVWCPTLDAPGQKSTTEMYLRVPRKYATLSNGVLAQSTANSDGTRTDYWKMDLPHSPYLFFVGVGEFSIYKEKNGGKEISYYMDRQWAPMAQKIFGKTPEMIDFFSKKTGVPFPWPKYAQVVVKGYFSGSMENTTSTLHGESALQDSRELRDENKWENTIAHEVFHQWFGDYVTAESWSNLALNESFARYGEYLWIEYKYGRQKADELMYNSMLGYVYGPNTDKELVRFHYAHREDLFNEVVYNKGAAMLNMLRNYIGDESFFAGLHKYLVDYKFKTAEMHQLRLVFEEVTGQDLNWFFDQWAFRAGHPQLLISYDYNEGSGKVTVNIKQTQKSAGYRLPMAIDVYAGGEKKRYSVVMMGKDQNFELACNSRPDLVNVDADKVLLCDKEDHKELAQYIFQYGHAGNYIDRREAINACLRQVTTASIRVVKDALANDFEGIRFHTLMAMELNNDLLKKELEPIIADMAQHDPSNIIRARAIFQLRSYDPAKYHALFVKSLDDSSYYIAGEALEALLKSDNAYAMQWLQKIKRQPVRGKLGEVVTNVLMVDGTPEDFDILADRFDQMPISEDKFNLLTAFAESVSRINNTERLKKGVDIIIRFRNSVPYPFKTQTDPYINDVILKNMIDKKKSLAANPQLDEQLRYINTRMGN